MIIKKHLRYAPECQSPTWQSFGQHIDDTLAHSPHVFKSDGTSTVWLSHVDGQPVVVKRINTTGLWQTLKRCLRTSRPKYNWQNAERLRAIGVPTFKPLILVEERLGPLLWGKSYLVTNFLVGEDAGARLTKGQPNSALWHDSVQQMVQTMRTLHRHHLSHRDLNPSNLLFVDGTLHLLDLDAMRPYKIRILANLLFKRECARFLENWRDAPEKHPDLVPFIESALVNNVY